MEPTFPVSLFRVGKFLSYCQHGGKDIKAAANSGLYLSGRILFTSVYL